MIWRRGHVLAAALLAAACGGSSSLVDAPDSRPSPPPEPFIEFARAAVVSDDPPDRALGEFASAVAFENGSPAWLIARRPTGLPAASHEIVAHSLSGLDVEPTMRTAGLLVGACPVGGDTEDVVLVVDQPEPAIAQEVWAFVSEERRFVPLFQLAGRSGWAGNPEDRACGAMGDGEGVLVLAPRSAPEGIVADTELATFWITQEWVRERATVGACESRECLPILTEHGRPLAQLPSLAAIVGSGELWRIVWSGWTKELTRCRIDGNFECRGEHVATLGEGLAPMFHVGRLGTSVLVTQIVPAGGQVNYRVLDLEGTELAEGSLPTTGNIRYAVSEGQLLLGDGADGFVAVRLSWDGTTVHVERRALPAGLLGLVSFHDGLAVVAEGSAPDRVGIYDMSH